MKTISVRTKKWIMHNIDVLNTQLRIVEDVCKICQSFKDKKLVKKTLLEAVEKTGWLRARFYEGPRGDKRLTVWNDEHDDYCVVICTTESYISIQADLMNNPYKSRLKDYEKMLEVYDEEVKRFEQLVEYINKEEFLCVSLWSMQMELRTILDKLKNGEMA